jgi:hypothetical protein
MGANIYNWSAWSEPTGKGNRRNLGGSANIDYDKADRELTVLFAKLAK